MDEEDVDIMDVVEGEGKIDTDIDVAPSKQRKEVQEDRRTRYAGAKLKTSAPKKHIAIKRKVFERPSPLDKSLAEEESGSISKRRKVPKEDKVLFKEERNEMLKSQKVW